MEEEKKSDNEEPDEDPEEMDNEELDDDSDSDSEDPIKSIKAFKRLVIRTLEENEMSQKRACKMEIIDFLNLLKIMNENGIHFK